MFRWALQLTDWLSIHLVRTGEVEMELVCRDRRQAFDLLTAMKHDLPAELVLEATEAGLAPDQIKVAGLKIRARAGRTVDDIRDHEALLDRLGLAMCGTCKRAVLSPARHQAAAGFLAECGRRIATVEECRPGGCSASAPAGPT